PLMNSYSQAQASVLATCADRTSNSEHRWQYTDACPLQSGTWLIISVIYRAMLPVYEHPCGLSSVYLPTRTPVRYVYLTVRRAGRLLPFVGNRYIRPEVLFLWYTQPKGNRMI